MCVKLYEVLGDIECPQSDLRVFVRPSHVDDILPSSSLEHSLVFVPGAGTGVGKDKADLLTLAQDCEIVIPSCGHDSSNE